jgi:hypothetical protein
MYLYEVRPRTIAAAGVAAQWRRLMNMSGEEAVQRNLKVWISSAFQVSMVA